MDKARFLDNLHRGRRAWLALLAEVGVDRMTEPGLAGAWSGKDIVAHVAWFEREMVGLIRQRALAGSNLWQLRPDERNAAIHQQNKDRDLAKVVAEEAQAYAQLVDAVETLSDQYLMDASRFRDMPADWVPWEIIADNSYRHYIQHTPGIRRWLGDGLCDAADPHSR